MINRLLLAGTQLTAATVLQVAMVFVGNIALLRILGPAEFGQFAVALAGVSLIAAVLSLRLGVVITRASDSEFTDDFQRRYFTAILAETVLIAVVSGLWLLASGRRSWTDALLVFSIALQAFCSADRAFWERTMQYRRLAIAETAVVAVAQIVGVAVVLQTRSDAALYIREAAGALAMFVALHMVGGLTFRPLAWPKLREWRSVLREARAIWLDSILEGIFQRVTVLAAVILAGDRGAGLFSMAQRLAVLPHQIIQPFGRVASNWFSRTALPDIRRQGRDQLIVVLTVPLLLGTLLTILLADPLVPWLFGPHWRDVVPILLTLSGVMIFMTLFEIMRGYALSMRKTSVLLGSRMAQFSVLAIAFGSALAAGDAGLLYLGYGLSGAFAAAFAIQMILLRRSD